MFWILLTACTGPSPTPTGVATPAPPTPTGLGINEVMSDNRTTLADPADPVCPGFDDWIELINTTDSTVDLAGVSLEDSVDSWPLPDRDLAPGERLLIWADGEPEQGPLHANLRVSKGGETLRLVAGNEVLDEVIVPPLGPDESFARTVDGGATMVITDRPTPGEANGRDVPDDPCFVVTGFDDHAYRCIPDEAGYLWLAGARTELAVVKFGIFNFQSPATRHVEFMDSTFYALHDQFYIYTLLNGQPFGNLDQYPPHPGNFATWKELNDFALAQDLPALFDTDMMRFSGDRLFSPYFYREINGIQRDLGVGTIVHRPGDAQREPFWGFELGNGDDIDAADLAIYFEVLAEHGPPEFDGIVWLVRSQAQEALAAQLEHDGHPLGDRLLRYSELSEPGEIEVYNPGLTAGSVYMVRAGEDGLDDSRADYVLVLDEVPDYLPPARALVTNVPQTPLSHVALLARSRGIPNVHIAGVTLDAQWDAWKRVRHRIVLEVTQDGVRVTGMDAETYSVWIGLTQSTVPEIAVVDPASLPYSIALDGLGDVLELRTTAGGKVAGMEQLVATPGLDTPDQPLGLTVRAYREHMHALPPPDGLASGGWLELVLNEHPFIRTFDTALRYAVSEGPTAYGERYPSVSDTNRLHGFLSQRPPGHLTGDLIRSGGLRTLVEQTPMPSAALSAIEGAVQQRLGALPADGLRFRSSSTVEDIEGFNGAGLYSSHTGFLNGTPTVEDAVRRVFGSYWGFEAVEERQQAEVDHLDGAMGVLVHPRFEDLYERANMVLTITRLGPGQHELLVNAQVGAISVANPPNTCPPILPEQVRVDATTIERLATSTETTDDVLSDAELRALFDQGVEVAEAWLHLENSRLPEERQREVLTLDLEARAMEPGWVGSSTPRLVIKQSRSLDPSTGKLPVEFRTLPAPQDLLARVSSIDRMTCTATDLIFTIDTLLTDPLQPPDVGYSTDAFVFQVGIEVLTDQHALGWASGGFVSWNHLDLSTAAVLDSTFDLELDDGTTVVSDGTGWAIVNALGHSAGEAPSCVSDTLWASPHAFLFGLL